MGKSLSELIPTARQRAEAALAECKEKKIQVVVTSVGRIYLEQYALWCQGRKTLLETNEARKKATEAGADMPPILEYTGRDKKTHSDNDYIVTNCDGTRLAEGGSGRSAHQIGIALDVVPDLDPSEKERPGWPPISDSRWNEIATIFEKHGFEAGLRWTKAKDGLDADPPHYQLK